MEWSYLKAIGSLIFIIILIVVTLYILKKYIYKDYGVSKSNPQLKILSHLGLQPKKFIYVVKTFNKILILGVSENNINLLSEVSDLESIKMIENSLSEKRSFQSKSFIEHLKNNLGIKS